MSLSLSNRIKIFFSFDINNKLSSLVCTIELLSLVFILFSVENERSEEHDVAGMATEIAYARQSVGYALLNLYCAQPGLN